MEFGRSKVLMISSDRNILTPGSAVALRMKKYGELVEELHIVLLSDRSHELTVTELGKNVWVYPTNSSSKWFRSRDAAKLGKKLIVSKKFVRGEAVITAQDPFECGLAGLKVKRKWRIPLEIQLHTDPFSPYFKGFLNKLRMRIARRVMPQADGVRVVTSALAGKIAQEFSISPEKTSVLPIYVPQKLEEYIPFDLHSRFGWKTILLSVARLTPEKNISLALKVLQKVLEKYPEAGLVVVGDGPEKEKLTHEAKHFRVDQSVAFVGWQEHMAPYYKTANIFLQTSLFEGYGLALIEAGLAGLPIVTTPVGVALEFADDKEIMVAEPTAETLAEKALALISDSEKAQMIAAEMKRALETKLVSEEVYLERLKENWEQTAARIHT